MNSFVEMAKHVIKELEAEGRLKTESEWIDHDAQIEKERNASKRIKQQFFIEKVQKLGLNVKELVIAKTAKIPIYREIKKGHCLSLNKNTNKVEVVESSVNQDTKSWRDLEHEYTMKSYFKYLIGSSVFIFGDIGTGKTLIAHRIASIFLKQGKKVLFVEDLEFKCDATSISKGDTLVTKYMEADLLIFDDTMRTAYRQTTIELFNEIVIYRTKKDLTTVITSEKDIRKTEYGLLDTTVDRMNTKYITYMVKGGSKRKSYSQSTNK